jgi:hypothetical protein
MKEDSEAIETKVNELINLLNLKDSEKESVVKDVIGVIQKYAQEEASKREYSLIEERASLPVITRNQVQQLTGYTSKLLDKYIDTDGISSYDVLEMHIIATQYGSTLPILKNRLHDEKVPVDHMSAILEAREAFTDDISTRAKKTQPSLHQLVGIYHQLDGNHEEFKDLMQFINENQNYRHTSKSMPSFIGSVAYIYTREGKRDLSLTLDLMDAIHKKSRGDAVHAGMTMLEEGDFN